MKRLLSSNTSRFFITFSALGALLTGCGGLASSVQPPLARSLQHPIRASGSEQVVYSFTGYRDGGDPAADLTIGSDGAFYGTTVVGGYYNCGTIFKATPRSSPPWQESALYSFTCYGDGKNPYGGVTFDKKANLYGTTVSGGNGGSCGSTGCGVAWELQGSAESVLHSFTGGDDGFGPGGGLTMDRKGNMYGTTPDGGAHYSGVIYELSQHKGSWRERVIHAFNGGSEGGVGSLGRLLVNADGDLYGVTEIGGAYNAGTVYRLRRVGGKWHFTTLYAFKGSPDCGSPYGGLTAGNRAIAGEGTLFGTTYYGGANGLGCIFELRNKGRRYRERVLYSFSGGNDGSSPTSTLLLAGKSTLYGTTSMGGGSCDCGTVFKVDGKTGAESVLHSFAGGQDGSYPYYGLARDSTGTMYGTTATGGTENQGVIFEVTP